MLKSKIRARRDGLLYGDMANLAVCRGTALALGIHSRIDAAVERILARLPHGNTYLDRNMIGAVAGRGKIALRK